MFHLFIILFCSFILFLDVFSLRFNSQSNIGESAMIINTDEIKNIYVSKKYCDMRKQIAGLSLIVTSEFKMNVLDHSLFIFTNASRNRIKMLYYEANGFWLFTRRLENGKFKLKMHEVLNRRFNTPHNRKLY